MSIGFLRAGRTLPGRVCQRQGLTLARGTHVEALMVEQMPEIPVGTHYIAQQYLYAFASQGEILHYVRTQATDSDRERMPEIMQEWEKVQSRVTEVLGREAGLAETISVGPVPEEYQGIVVTYISDPLFRNTFSGLPIHVGVVEVDKLVAGQRMVNLGYVERLTGQYGSSPTFEDDPGPRARTPGAGPSDLHRALQRGSASSGLDLRTPIR